MQNPHKIWYACYGSNLLESRFMCYIKGGQPNGTNKNYEGCNDKTSPTDSKKFNLNNELYFSKQSETWGHGGVAFVKTIINPNIVTLGKIYLITREQLVDIAKQETNTESELSIDFEKAINNGFCIFKKDSRYGNLLYLGEQDGYPIFTLTNKKNLEKLTKPTEEYLKTIVGGIKESYNFDSNQIFEYLQNKKGITGNYNVNTLKTLLE